MSPSTRRPSVAPGDEVVAEHREVQAAEAPGGDVEEEASVIVVVAVVRLQVEHDPVAWAETEAGYRGERRWLGDGRAPG